MKSLEAARRLAGGPAFLGGLGQFGGDLGFQAHVAGQAEQVIDPVYLAPRRQRLAAEAANRPVAASAPCGQRPYLGNDPGHFLDRPGRAFDVRTPQLGRSRCRPQKM